MIKNNIFLQKTIHLNYKFKSLVYRCTQICWVYGRICLVFIVSIMIVIRDFSCQIIVCTISQGAYFTTKKSQVAYLFLSICHFVALNCGVRK